MNRRSFIKSNICLALSFPFITLGISKEKRSPNSLFTIDELRTYCKMNGLHYVEDNEIWIDKDNQKMMTYNNKNYWLCHRFPFVRKKNTDDWYGRLKWDVLMFSATYEKFFLYDIEETTLPCQKERGEFYSMVVCAKKSYFCPIKDSISEIKKRMMEKKIYCIKEHCYYKPLVGDYDIIYDLVKI